MGSPPGLLGCAGRWLRGTANTALPSGHRLTSVTEELAEATETVLSRQEEGALLQRELWKEEQSTHPRAR